MAPLKAAKQRPFGAEDIAAMQEWVPRRCMLASEWKNLVHPSNKNYENPSVVLPFYETLGPCFDIMVGAPHIGVRRSKDGQRAFTFLQVDDDAPEIDAVHAWHATVGQFVAIRDNLALSFALDYDRAGGDPNRSQTRVAKLRGLAKPYGRTLTPETRTAAAELVDECNRFLDVVTCYSDVNAVVAMPPSDPKKSFDLPTFLADGVADARNLKDLSPSVQTIKLRPALKEMPLEKKLATLKGTVAVGAVQPGTRILLLDDLYQSGISMNYVASCLLEAGAEAVYGLSVEKTCRNDANV